MMHHEVLRQLCHERCERMQREAEVERLVRQARSQRQVRRRRLAPRPGHQETRA
jgi:hypothetical protein